MSEYCSSKSIIPVDRIEHLILFVRGQKVIIDEDLAELYGVKTKELNKSVSRNFERFPDDFAFKLTKQEWANLKFQFGTSSLWGGRRKFPRVFTEQGVAMLSSVLHSKRAVSVNIEIMRAFVRLRRILSEHKELEKKLIELEQKYDVKFKIVFDAIRNLMTPPDPKHPPIGYKI